MLWPQAAIFYTHAAFLHVACGAQSSCQKAAAISGEALTARCAAGTSISTQTQGCSWNNRETYRIRGRQQAPLDKSFKRSLQNKVLLRDGLLGDLLCWQCLHMLRNTESRGGFFQVTVTTCCFQLKQVGLLASLAQLLFLSLWECGGDIISICCRSLCRAVKLQKETPYWSILSINCQEAVPR